MNLNLQGKQQNTFDAIVIGSGASGGWAAKELCEKGLKTLVLERGRELKHIEGYKTANLPPWEFQHRGRITTQQRETHPYLQRDYPYSEHNESYWFDDLNAPYEEKARFDWYRPDIVGGKSIMWGRQSYRLSDIDFEANIREGIGIDWPIRYKDIAPWYDYVEKFVGISGQKEGLPQLPDGQFIPPMEMNCVEKKVKEGIESNFKGRVMTMGRVANLTQRVGERGPCQYRNLCSRGCPYSGYFASQAATLPAAEATGNMTLMTDSIVNSIIYDEQQGKATGVRVINARTNETAEYYAKIIFVNGSTIWSTWLLMNSTSNRFPDGLGNDSGVLGRYLMDHHFRTGARGVMEGFEDKYFYGRRPNGIYIPRFRNLNGEKRDYVRGFGYQGSAGRGGWNRAAEEGIGASFKDSLSEPGQWTMGIGGFGECLPYEDNRMMLNKDKLDKWGQPTVVFECSFKENEQNMRKDMANDAAEMLEAAGCKDVRTYDNGSWPGMAIHEMGTARMGKNPKESVLNEWNQVHACKNVFVTDGACMTSASCVNPTLTYMALTARAADYAVKELKRMNL